jgi:SNF2 family DNA or RNA helicase
VRLELKDYQRAACQHIITHERCAMHMDVGTGKTATTLTAIIDLLGSLDIRGAMVFAPLRVATIAWPEELRKWDQFAKVRAVVVRGTADKREALLRTPADIYLLNYDLLPWWVEWVAVEVRQRRLHTDMLVLDESSRLKASSSARFKSLRPVADSKLFRRIVELTGTPAPEDYEDLWSQYRLLDGGAALKPYVTHFRKTYYTQNPYNIYEWKLNKGADVVIQDRIAPLTFTARRQDYLDLPALIERQVLIDLPANARKHYSEVEKDMLTVLNDTTVAAPSAAIVSEKCRQVCSGGLYTADGTVLPLHEAKFDALDEILEDIPTSQNILVAYWYKHEMLTIRQRYQAAPVLGPNLSEIEALRRVREWNDRKHRLLFMHPASVGHGINLQAGGNHLVFLTLPWSNELVGQTIGRLYRMGQERAVTVHRILCRDTVEERVDAVINSKEATQAKLRLALANVHNPI